MSIEIQKENDPYSLHARLGISLFLTLLVMVLASSYFNIPKYSAPVAIHIPRAESSREITHGDKTKQQVIFTFDGGSGAQSTDKVLAILAKHGIKGTFFLTGQFVEKNPDYTKRIVAAGHEVFNHTYDHPHLPEISNEQINRQLRRMESDMKAVVGMDYYSRPYFRAPYGDRDDRVIAEAFKQGYQSVYWTIDARDWMESTGMTAKEVRNRILNNLAPGNIYLMHLGDTITGAVLDDIFSTIESKGYKIVSLTQGL